jgi:flagellar biogenesis protein FliO
MTPAALAVWILLGGMQQAPLWAQTDARADPADPASAVSRPTHRSASVNSAAGRDDGSEAASRKTSADDPESQPLPSAQKAPASPPVEDTGSLALDVLVKLGLVVALMLAGAAAWKRLRGATPAQGVLAGQALQVTSTASLGPQRFLHLVTVGRHQLLVGSSPQTVCLIAVLEGGASGGMSAAASPAAVQAQGAAVEIEHETAAVPEPADRFEELVLQMREREAGRLPGQSIRSRPAAATEDERELPLRDSSGGAAGSRVGAGRNGDPRSARMAGLSTNPLFEPAGGAKLDDETRPGVIGPTSGAPERLGRTGGVEAGERSLAPGSLFRTSSAAARSGPDA